MILLVCGFGRCGSSLVMQMLAAGGMPVLGEFPDYEDRPCLPTNSRALQDIDGRAVKLLDPHRHPIPQGPRYRAVWLDRNPKQQAKSMAKFLRVKVGAPLKRREVKELAASFVADRRLAVASVRNVCSDTIQFFRFEEILADPMEAAQRLECVADMALDLSAMTRAVLARDPDCQPDMRIESTLLQAREVV